MVEATDFANWDDRAEFRPLNWAAVGRILVEACALEEEPRYLIRDRDRVYGERFSRQAKTLDIREVVMRPARRGKTRMPNGSLDRFDASASTMLS